MTIAEGSGKGHKDENFPVASALISPAKRPVVLAFYRVARMADDVADHETLSPEQKLAQLDLIEAGLCGTDDRIPEASRLRAVLAERGLADTHIRDLLTAFRRDAVKSRYADWADLMDYCRYSAAPVGRFMLDVHGESRAAWPASDALCAALQVINHLQDCGEDYRRLDRVYVPLDALGAAGLEPDALAAGQASPALARVIHRLAEQTMDLLGVARPIASQVRDLRLALEIGVIQAIAEDLTRRLSRRDPLAQRVSLGPLATLAAALRGGAGVASARILGRQRHAAAA